jgi:hypothetical protein
MNFKNKALKLQEEKDNFREIINKGIIKFNNINKKDVESIEEIEFLTGYDTVTDYICGEKGITIIWFEEIGRCGESKKEKRKQLIPYIYFEKNEDLNLLDKDIEKRKIIKNKISVAIKEEIEINSKKLNLEKDIRDLNHFSYKHGIDTNKKISEKKEELVSCKAELNRKKEEIKKLKKEEEQ